VVFHVNYVDPAPITHSYSAYTLSPLRFDQATLVSTLRIATAYGHDGLRKFAIWKLELKKLPLIDYVPLAREYNVPSWEANATNKLALRPEPVSFAEARVLGMEAFVSLVARREAESSRRPQPRESSGSSVDTSELEELLMTDDSTSAHSEAAVRGSSQAGGAAIRSSPQVAGSRPAPYTKARPRPKRPSEASRPKVTRPKAAASSLT
jgi:hypothetical protein